MDTRLTNAVHVPFHFEDFLYIVLLVQTVRISV
jgi:hypothetical protein